MRTRAILLLFAISLLWGSNWIFAPLLADVTEPYAAAALPTALAALLLALLWVALRLVSGRRAVPVPHAAVPFRVTVRLGLVMLALPSCLIVLAGHHDLGGWEFLVYALLPLLVALADQNWTAPMVLAAGAVYVLFGSTLFFTPRRLAVAAVGLTAVALQSYGLRFAAKALRGRGWTALTGSLALQLGMAALLLAACSLLFDAKPSISPADYWRTNAAISLFWFTLAGTAVPYLIFYFLLAQGRLAPVQVAVSQWIQVLFAVAESAYFMRAFPSWEMLAAVATLVVCVWMLLRRDRDSSPVSIVLRDTPL